ncbi:DUF2141 domain-containing protein [Psychroserpens sp. NJDZ02]|uniref:DUF2141 domain-containing protein n=1 Tax=Psychroserpens sp. NJDZ02 TaxID=2570561 RepID=UPI001F0DDC89|nr:DUF2141 domain-containing protein [Psychroserpens sp. NJDZ02]
MNTIMTSNRIKRHVLNTLILFTLSITCTVAQTDTKLEQGQTITVTVTNVKNNTGQIGFALHTTETWMKGQGIQHKNISIKNNTATITFKNVKPGAYAIMVLHDENKNNRMDFENGMPLENYGMSNNPMSYGPPQFSEAKFNVTSETLDFKIRF